MVISLEVKVDSGQNIAWLSTLQMVQLFNREASVIRKHINNVSKEFELERNNNEHFLHIIGLKKPVPFDRDVAELYGVETKRINEAVKNNPEMFPYGYLFELDKYEKKELVENFDRFNSLKHSTVSPTAFTERGLYMLATILKSPIATKVTIAIIDTLTLVREMTRKMEKLQDINRD